MPFGIGKRVCLGESLATMEIFIFLVMMLQRLNFDPPIDHKIPDVNKYSCGFSKIPEPFYVSVSERTMSNSNVVT